ncbi:DDX54 [Cordylochernes scorpioides]|uniref:DDX54 n=1 Tax=Cordylochernes scorpioides TaxID=51811 RepID=A0ABY6JX94_9ARAC|nr:DDX54 [Cordylochernes scorpioides]
MNQQAELHEIISKLPSESRQTMLFSATLPKMLVDFAGVGLNNPQLIRLDVESKLSEQLRSTYLYCRSPENRMATLLCLLDLIPKGQLTLVFAATRHHVEYIAQVLTALQMPCTAVYSSLDQEARETNVRMFKNHTVELMIATDVAARGIDIPPLDNVINYNFPSNSKLYVHRVGRVARAGRAGTSYSILAYDEAAYLVDLHLFLGRQLVCATLETSIDAGKYLQGQLDDNGRTT